MNGLLSNNVNKCVSGNIKYVIARRFLPKQSTVQIDEIASLLNARNDSRQWFLFKFNEFLPQTIF